MSNNKIHPTAIISKNAHLDESVSVGAFTIIHDNVVIGANSKIDSFCELGVSTNLAKTDNLIFSENTHIRSHSIFYSGSSFGSSLITGHRVSVRENTIAGENFQIGTLSDIQGDCLIGDFVRTHSNVHIGKKSVIGNFVWLFPYCVLTNDPHPPSNILLGVKVEDFAVVATMSVILPGVTLGRHCFVAAHSCVGKDVSPNTIVAGAPAKELGPTTKIKIRDGSDRSAYPWTQHFHRGYPQIIVDQWKQDLENNTNSNSSS